MVVGVVEVVGVGGGCAVGVGVVVLVGVVGWGSWSVCCGWCVWLGMVEVEVVGVGRGSCGGWSRSGCGSWCG